MRLVTPDQYKSIPWKNGKGDTVELAISEGGSLHSFDWRLSMADVTVDGPFSLFETIDRHLILLEGRGIELTHDGLKKSRLEAPLQVAKFSGESVTIASLIDGPIRDFNLMTRRNKYHVTVKTKAEYSKTQLQSTTLSFVYNTGTKPTVCNFSGMEKHLLENHLLWITREDADVIELIGERLIIIQLELRK